jgi:hypothetical protein
MEREKAQDIDRSGKGDGGNTGSAGDKNKWRGKDNRNTNIIYVLSPYIYCMFRDDTPSIGRQTAGPPRYMSPNFHTATDKVTVSGTLNSFRNPRR